MSEQAAQQQAATATADAAPPASSHSSSSRRHSSTQQQKQQRTAASNSRAAQKRRRQQKPVAASKDGTLVDAVCQGGIATATRVLDPRMQSSLPAYTVRAGGTAFVSLLLLGREGFGTEIGFVRIKYVFAVTCENKADA